MPLIRPRHVLSFSSEDVAQPAQNLLKSETYRKWRCASGGEKQASIILELERAMRIHSIDIGNNGSALVEVLVGRSSWSSNEQYQVLLVASSFMSPAESKSFTNINRVRMFGPDKLSKPVAAQKWDRIKLICTQPFNKNEQYGLSFINLHSPPEDTDEDDVNKTSISSPSVANPASKRLGRFTLKDDSDNEEKTISSGSLFFKKLQKKASPPPMSMAAEVRAASTATASSSDDKRTSDTSGFKATKDRQSVPSDRQPVALNRHTEVKDKKEKSRTTSPKPEQKSAERRISESTKRKYDDLPKENSRGKSPPPSKRKRESVNKDNDSQVTFGEIMKDVVFVMSGFVNPERGNLRDKALQMGAQFKQDWGKGCTHLICAFANTPKFNQVKGKGKIVTKKWITDCFKKNRRLPTRDYHLPGDSSSSDESSDEKDIKATRPVKTTTSTERGERKRAGSKEETSPVSDKRPIGKNTQASEATETKDEPKKANDADDIYGGSTDDESAELNQSKEIEHVAPPRSKEASSSSDLDTEDELKRVQGEDKDDEDDIYGGTTDDEQEETTKKDEAESADDVTSGSEDLPELPDFFSHKHFMLYGEIESTTRRLLIRYITAYNGIVEEYMSDNVDFVITNENWDRNFDEALNENASLAFVRPKWIMVCHEKGALVPFQPYIIVPS